MITTFQQHILQQQREVPYASGDFSWLLSGITLAAKMIEAKIRSAGLSGIVGTAGSSNVQGEAQQKLDVYANEALLHCLGVRDSVAALVSEENDHPVTSQIRYTLDLTQLATFETYARTWIGLIERYGVFITDTSYPECLRKG